MRVVPIRWIKTHLNPVTRSAEGQNNLNQDESTTQREKFDINFQAKRVFPDERLNTCAGTATDTQRQVYGSLPTLQMNSVTSLPCSTLLLCSILLSPFPQSRGPQPSAVRANISSAYPPTLPLHFRNGCGNTSTEHTDSFQPAKKSRRHTSNNSLVLLTQTVNQISV